MEVRTAINRAGEPRAGAAWMREAAVRFGILILYVPLMVRVLEDAAASRRLTGILFLCSTSLVVLFTLLRRSTETVDRSPAARLITATAVAGPLLFRPGGDGLLSDQVTSVLSCVGLAVSIGGTLSLRRSFGLMPANRGVVRGGLYRVIRHPIYAGYLLSHVAFVLTFPTPWNLLVWAASDGAQLVRARYEERLLRCDPSYARYVAGVRWRLVPGIY